MDIYFEDSNGNRVEVTDDMTITVTIPDGYKTPIVCYTDTKGSSTVLDSTVIGNAIIFKTNHNSYYSIVEKKSNTLNPTINNNGSSAQTGDSNCIVFWLSVLFILGDSFVIMVTIKKQKNYSNK